MNSATPQRVPRFFGIDIDGWGAGAAARGGVLARRCTVAGLTSAETGPVGPRLVGGIEPVPGGAWYVFGGIEPVPGGAWYVFGGIEPGDVENIWFGGMLAGFAAVAAYGLGCGGTLWYCGAWALELFVGGMVGGGIAGGP